MRDVRSGFSSSLALRRTPSAVTMLNSVQLLTPKQVSFSDEIIPNTLSAARPKSGDIDECPAPCTYPPAPTTVAAVPPTTIFPTSFVALYRVLSPTPLPTVTAEPLFRLPTQKLSVNAIDWNLRVWMRSECLAVERPKKSCPDALTDKRRLCLRAKFTPAYQHNQLGTAEGRGESTHLYIFQSLCKNGVQGYVALSADFWSGTPTKGGRARIVVLWLSCQPGE